MSPARSMSGEPLQGSRIAALPGTSSEDPELRPNNIIPIAHLEAGQPCARGARTIPGSTPHPSRCQRMMPVVVVIPVARRRRIPGRIATSTRPRRTDPPPAKSSSCSSVNPCASRNCPRGHESSTPEFVKTRRAHRRRCAPWWSARWTIQWANPRFATRSATSSRPRDRTGASKFMIF